MTHNTHTVTYLTYRETPCWLTASNYIHSVCVCVCVCVCVPVFLISSLGLTFCFFVYLMLANTLAEKCVCRVTDSALSG